jgi:microcystin-dependent protein
MALGIRGANPIWSEVDLQGKLFDDTFYLFVLQNDIPYIPATVYHDPDLNVPWTQPIQFLANGTLPIDIYFEGDTVYRLEYRQGPTQQYPLIYEVDNYVAGPSGSIPVDTIASTSSNQVTNPQFALMYLQSPVTISATNPSPYEIAPGWFLDLAGTGTATITQVPLNNADPNPSNAPYALRLTLSGWTADSVILRQRFEQNGMLWANKIVSTAVTAKVNGSPQAISANLVDSNNSVLGTVLPLSSLDEDFNEFTGYAELPASTKPDVPPVAYVDYALLIPSNIDIYLTSFQLVVQDLPIQPSFEQDTINRQIDHSYNRAFPIVPPGTILDFAGFTIPEHFYLCDGSTRDRVRDYVLFNAITFTESVSFTDGLNTFTTSNIQNYYIGEKIESANIPANTTVTNLVGTTVTMSANATISSIAPVTLFPWGDGDGSTTFNLPNFQGYTSAGTGGILFAANINAVGLSGGEINHLLTVAEIPAHTHEYIQPNSGGSGGSPAGGQGTSLGNTVGGSPGGGAHNNVQPTILVNKIIRYH